MGKLIVLEGTDGSGKSTQFARLTGHLQTDGITFERVVFPQYDKPSSALLRMYLHGEFGAHPEDVNSYAASTFYAVDRYASFHQVWQRHYESGGLVLADRWTTSNAVHQGPKSRRSGGKPSLTGCMTLNMRNWACRNQIWCYIWTCPSSSQNSSCDAVSNRPTPRQISMNRI